MPLLNSVPFSRVHQRMGGGAPSCSVGRSQHSSFLDLISGSFFGPVSLLSVAHSLSVTFSLAEFSLAGVSGCPPRQPPSARSLLSGRPGV